MDSDLDFVCCDYPYANRLTIHIMAAVAEDEARRTSERTKAALAALKAKGFGPITTEITPAGPFYFAETHHQQYLAKNPGGYCGLGGTGVSCPIGLAKVSG